MPETLRHPITLRRTLRFAVNPDGSTAGGNGFGGRPAMRGLGRHYELTIACRGEPDPETGYLLGIQDIDAAARRSVVPRIARACAEAPTTEPSALLPELARLLGAELPGLVTALRWNLTPTYSVEVAVPIDARSRVLVRQRFDFAAAHRLHCPGRSDEDNRRIFGKCNNPSGHGHNYQVEPAVAVPAEADAPLERIESVVDRVVLDAFDHTHLNEDTDAFRTGSGVNPSVENIARVCFERLAPEVAAEIPGAELRGVTVWETDRTSATYPA